MKKTLITSCFLVLFCALGYSQKIVLVNGEAVKVKIDDNEIIEVVEDNVDNYMIGFEETNQNDFKTQEEYETGEETKEGKTIKAIKKEAKKITAPKLKSKEPEDK